MVRLLLPEHLGAESLIELVSIPQWCDCCKRLHSANLVWSGFNPTMVRLLPVLRRASLLQVSQFQSHNGAIAAHRDVSWSGFQFWCFNPTMVRLLPPTALIVTLTASCFNPTMVRLLRDFVREMVRVGESFNPTMVRLLLSFITPNEWWTWFQSHNGAIAASFMVSFHSPSTSVSIPQWCDCCWFSP